MRQFVKSSNCLPPERAKAFRRLQRIAKRRALQVTYSHMSGEYIVSLGPIRYDVRAWSYDPDELADRLRAMPTWPAWKRKGL